MARQKFKIDTTKTISQPFVPMVSEAGNQSAFETKKNDEANTIPSVSLVKETQNHPMEIKFIPRKKIQFHEKNDYDQENIGLLAESILNFGLIHPMEAYYDNENDIYILESGERRTRAIDMLLEKYLNAPEDTDSFEYQCFLKHVKNYANGYPLHIVRVSTNDDGEMTELEKIDSLIRLDEANLQVRELQDPLQRAKYLQRRKELLQMRNSLLPQDSRINVNKKLAEQSGITERTVMKYTAIADKLIPELQEEFRKNNISLNDGSRFSQLSEDEQHYILQLIRNGEKASKEEIKQLLELVRQKESEKEKSEAEIVRLKSEKEKAYKLLQEQLQTQEAARLEIERKIREEVAEEQELNTYEREALKKVLEDKEKQISVLKKNAEEKSKNAEEKIEALEKKLSILENTPAITPKEEKVLRLTVTYQTALKNLQNDIDDTCNILKTLTSLAPEKKEELISDFLTIIQNIPTGGKK